MQRIVTTTNTSKPTAKRQRSRTLLSPDAPRKHSVPSPDDPDRAKLIAIVEERGPPIDRVNGMQADRRWSAKALAYIEAEHTGYILKHVRALGARHIPEEDLVQAAKIGALRALETFDLDKAGRFLTHGKWWIRCETGKLVNRTESLVIVPPDVRRERERLLRDCPPDMSDEDAALAVDLPVDRVRELRSLHLGHEHRQITRSAGVRRSLAQVAASAEDRREALRQQIAVGDSLSRVSALGRRVLFESLGALDMLADDPEALRVRPPNSKQARKFVLEGVLDTLRQELAEVAPQSRRSAAKVIKQTTHALDVVHTACHTYVLCPPVQFTSRREGQHVLAESEEFRIYANGSDEESAVADFTLHFAALISGYMLGEDAALTGDAIRLKRLLLSRVMIGQPTKTGAAKAPALDPPQIAPEPFQNASDAPVELPPAKPPLRSLAGLPRRNAGVAAETVAAAETTAPSSSTPLRSLRTLPSRQHTRLF